MVEVGEAAPEFCLPDSDEQEVCSSSYRGSWVVLYFYPRDNTSGCTREAVDFTAALPELQKMKAKVVGISKDLPASHRKFRESHGLAVLLLSDADHQVMQNYGVWALKKMYGKESYGVVRSTFLIDPQGNVASIWRSVKVKGHVDAVMKKLEQLTGKTV